MLEDLNKILDGCIDRINRGDSIESCLADHPGWSEQLKPLLQAVMQTKKAYTYEPDKEAKTAAKLRFDAAMEKRLKKEKETRSWSSRILGRPLTWVALVAVTAAIVGIYFGVNQMIYPISPFVPQPNPEGNFILFISDDVNAIGDFDSVDVSITKVGLFSEDNGGWMEFEPDVREVDLTTVQGDETQQIWRGNLPEGEYTKVFIYVNSVQGVLKQSDDANGRITEIKLPGNKLHIPKTFQISEGSVTSFTYDLTVIATGNEKSGIKYILKPQADESSAENKAASNKEKSNQE